MFTTLQITRWTLIRMEFVYSVCNLVAKAPLSSHRLVDTSEIRSTMLPLYQISAIPVHPVRKGLDSEHIFISSQLMKDLPKPQPKDLNPRHPNLQCFSSSKNEKYKLHCCSQRILTLKKSQSNATFSSSKRS